MQRFATTSNSVGSNRPEASFGAAESIPDADIC
jgi:hypothetical protein